MRRRFNYSNVMSTLSVFLVIAGGTALAASVPKNSVKSKSVKDNSLQGKDVRDNALTGADVEEGSLEIPEQVLPQSLPPSGPAGGSLTGNYPNPTLAQNSVGNGQLQDDAVTNPKVADNAVANAELADNSVTTAEVAPLSLTGADLGQDSVLGLNIAADSISSDELLSINVRQTAISVPAGGTNGGTQQCQNNEQLISGGAYVADAATMSLASTGPDLGFPNVMWRGAARNDAGAAQNLTIVAYCLEP